MKIANERSDALTIIRDVHRQVLELQKELSELEYLIYDKDERCEIKFFERGSNDERRGEERA